MFLYLNKLGNVTLSIGGSDQSIEQKFLSLGTGLFHWGWEGGLVGEESGYKSVLTAIMGG